MKQITSFELLHRYHIVKDMQPMFSLILLFFPWIIFELFDKCIHEIVLYAGAPKSNGYGQFKDIFHALLTSGKRSGSDDWSC